MNTAGLSSSGIVHLTFLLHPGLSSGLTTLAATSQRRGASPSPSPSPLRCSRRRPSSGAPPARSNDRAAASNSKMFSRENTTRSGPQGQPFVSVSGFHRSRESIGRRVQKKSHEGAEQRLVPCRRQMGSGWQSHET